MRETPQLERVLNDDFKSNTPSDETIRDIINLGDNITKLVTVEDLPLSHIHHTYPYIQTTIHATMKTVEVKITDDQGFIEKLFQFDSKQPMQSVRVISQQTGFDTRLILLLNEHLTKFQNSNYIIQHVTPNMVRIVNEIILERLCLKN